ncbi:ppg3-related protein-like protein [Leptomonas pyrrhocoris]|uniref:Ppg3-related protein-like protein n=1 Tax=Leptomonas pyrrhocoris TaxID=157538 RepID=A0A0N1J4Q6_LEPPY|nr:ppg3-related protein-like protein [Leptomonas pyrrhocoris]KPA79044.1 ppg3-related protein-like protein [Leptomonas pyrrhocoris]|eukprot:XP_015657483.1 ppg3-related protein-like protein [Leptomonas pyrrhocoris]
MLSGGTNAAAASSSSFDRWLKRAQRKRNPALGGLPGDYRNHGGDYHADPRGMRLSPSPRSSRQSPSHPPAASSSSGLYAPRPQSRLEELEGLLFTQSHFDRHHRSPGNESQSQLDEYQYTEVSDRPCQLPPTQRSLRLPVSEADLSSIAGGGGRRPSVNEPFGWDHELGDANPFLTGYSEAERYIVCLEEEVQTLTIESGEKDRLLFATAAGRDSMALQLEEMRRRGELERDEHVAVHTITYSFMRTLSFLRILEERSRAMELNTQISALKHELKLADMMRQEAHATATITAASSAATQEYQRRLEEQQLAQSVTATVRSLLQQEYARLADVMSEMPRKMQAILDEQQTKTKKETAVAATTAGALVASALAAASAATQQETHNQTTSKGQDADHSAGDTGVVPSQTANALRFPDWARLLGLVSRVHHYQETVSDLYCDAVDAKSSLVQYEMNLVRLIYEKQASLTWASLYEEKKSEVRHLKEKLMELRGELRAATSTATTGVSPRDVNGVGSFAGSASSQSYEAYAAPYVPLKTKSSTNSIEKVAAAGGTGRAGVGGGSAVPTRVPFVTKPIAELREEARRLGAHPAVHYPQPVTSPSPSMPSLFRSRTPVEVEETVLRQRSPDCNGSPHTACDRHSTPAVKSPVVALIRAFAPRSGSRSSSPATSSASSAFSSPAAPAKRAGVPPAVHSEMSAVKDTRAAAHGKRKDTRADEKKTRKRTTHASSPPLISSASMSSSVLSDDQPATPVPAPRGTTIKMPDLQRTTITTTGSSASSLSSHSSVSVKRPSLGNVVAVPRPTVSSATSKIVEVVVPPPPAAAAAQAVHNSFDDDNDSEEDAPVVAEKAAATAIQQQQQRLLVKTAPSAATAAAAAAAPRTSPHMNAASSKVDPTQCSDVKQPTVQVKRISIDETMRAIEQARRGSAESDEDDTSSLSLSITTASSSPPPRPAAKKAGAAVKPASRKATTVVLTRKSSHPRKSSFDDDDEDDGASSGGSTPLASNVQSTPAVGKSTVPALSMATSPTRAVPVAVSASAASKKPQRLKFPTW